MREDLIASIPQIDLDSVREGLRGTFRPIGSALGGFSERHGDAPDVLKKYERRLQQSNEFHIVLE
jgi:hypothetical protein